MRETKTFLACVDSSINNMKSYIFDTFRHFGALLAICFAFLFYFCVTFLAHV